MLEPKGNDNVVSIPFCYTKSQFNCEHGWLKQIAEHPGRTSLDSASSIFIYTLGRFPFPKKRHSSGFFGHSREEERTHMYYYTQK